MTEGKKKGLFRAFLDFFTLFGGVSTASNLSRTQPRPVKQRGMFLFRGKPKPEQADSKPGQSRD